MPSSTRAQAVEDLKEYTVCKQSFVVPVQELLGDLKLTAQLGAGGFSTVYQGLWRNTTSCAVKVFATPVPNAAELGGLDLSNSSGAITTDGRGSSAPLHANLLEALPLQVAAETLLSKDLSHPNVVQTYVVRCALLTAEFLAAVEAAKEAVLADGGAALRAKAAQQAAQLVQAAGAAAQAQAVSSPVCVDGQLRAANTALLAHSEQQPAAAQLAAGSGSNPVAGSNPRESRKPRSMHTTPRTKELSEEQHVACLLAEFGGITPLVPGWGSFSGVAPGGDALRGCSADEGPATVGAVDSLGYDGWIERDKERPLSWLEVLTALGAKAGDCVTVLVMEHARLGTLWNPIQMGLFLPNGYGAFSHHMRLRALLRTAREVATGLQHLHDCGVVHGDIKPANILLKDSRGDKRGFSAMVSDFGLSHIINDRSLKAGSRPSGTLQYMAPELLTKTHYSRASDMYAFGVMLCEMASGQVAYKGMKQGEVIQQVQRGNRPPWPEHTFPGMRELYVRCTAHNPVDRPTATELVEELGRLEAAVRAQAHADKRQANEAAQAWPAAARAEEQESGRAAAVAMAGMGSSAVGGSAATCRAGSSAAASSAAAAQHASPAQRSGRGGDMQVQVSKSGSSGSVIIRPIEISVSF